MTAQTPSQPSGGGSAPTSDASSATAPVAASPETLSFLAAAGAVAPQPAKARKPSVRLRDFERSHTRIRNRGPWPTTMVISFELSRPVRLVLAVRGPGPTCDLAGSIGIAGNKGLNLFPFDGLVRNRPLPPGTYKLTIRAKDGDRDLARTFVTIVAPGVPVKTRIRPRCTDPTALGASADEATPPFVFGGLTGTLIETRSSAPEADENTEAASGSKAPTRTSGTLGQKDEETAGLPEIPPLGSSNELERVLAILLAPVLLALLLTIGIALVRRQRLRRWARW